VNTRISSTALSVIRNAQRRTLGEYRNRPLTTIGGIVACAFLITLNAVLLILVFTGA
jgi:Mn2+/Fe2+ NRAMP family transporter